jgi:hypothetical protein
MYGPHVRYTLADSWLVTWVGSLLATYKAQDGSGAAIEKDDPPMIPETLAERGSRLGDRRVRFLLRFGGWFRASSFTSAMA